MKLSKNTETKNNFYKENFIKMECPKVKKDFPCGRQCVHIVRKTPWAYCACVKKKNQLGSFFQMKRNISYTIVCGG